MERMPSERIPHNTLVARFEGRLKTKTGLHGRHEQGLGLNMRRTLKLTKLMTKKIMVMISSPSQPSGWLQEPMIMIATTGTSDTLPCELLYVAMKYFQISGIENITYIKYCTFSMFTYFKLFKRHPYYSVG